MSFDMIRTSKFIRTMIHAVQANGCINHGITFESMQSWSMSKRGVHTRTRALRFQGKLINIDVDLIGT